MDNKRSRAFHIIVLSLCGVILSAGLTFGWDDPVFPRLANYFLPHQIDDRDVEILSRWDILIIEKKLDTWQEVRERIKSIEAHNPEIVLLMYTQSANANITESPPSPIAEACDLYDWWLRDYEGNKLEYENFPWSLLINMTNMEAASGNHPEGMKPNQFLADFAINDHLALYSYWDGIFYDTFADNLSWMHEDIKDANRNGIPEFDNEENGDEPKFASIWAEGALTLLNYTRQLDEDVIIVGNGLHKGALDGLNGRLLEGFRPSPSKNIHSFCSNHRYLTQGSQTPKISIINGSLSGPDMTAYKVMRFTFCATLMTDNYYSLDYGTQYHGEALWYDEYSLQPDGTVNARTTHLSGPIDGEQTNISVLSTQGFEPSGIVQIDGEQIYYEYKDPYHLMNCYRGYPRRTKYDLRVPHPNGSLVIQHNADNRHYLGRAYGPAFDASDPLVKLDDLLEAAGWSADEDEAENINSRVWRRDFENGTALVNPTDNSALVYGLGQKVYQKISGIQDPVHNNGLVIRDTLRIDPKDGYILAWISETDTIPPIPPEGLHIRP